MRSMRWIVGSAIVSALVSALYTPDGGATRKKFGSFLTRLGQRLGFSSSVPDAQGSVRNTTGTQVLGQRATMR